jgi:hypothetical protein
MKILKHKKYKHPIPCLPEKCDIYYDVNKKIYLVLPPLNISIVLKDGEQDIFYTYKICRMIERGIKQYGNIN